MKSAQQALMTLVVAAAVGCGGGSKQQQATVTYGAVVPLTGSQAQPSWADAIRLAESDFNTALQRHAFHDLRFNVSIQDSANDPTVAVPEAIDLVQQGGSKAIITDTSQNDNAIMDTYYDDDTTNDMGVPVQCSSCTSGSINNPTATGADPAATAALRDADGWNYTNNMSTSLISLVIQRYVKTLANGGDTNNDGVFKEVFYHMDDPSATSTITPLQTNGVNVISPNLSYEHIQFPANADVSSYDWAADFTNVFDNKNDSNGGAIDGLPDAVIAFGFAEQSAAIYRTYVQGGYGGGNVPLIFFHTARIGSVLQSLGSLAEGLQGVSHVLIDDGDIGQLFATEIAAATGVGAQYRDSEFYDNTATFMLAAAVAANDNGVGGADLTGPQIRDAMLKINDANGEVVGVGPDAFVNALQVIEAGGTINYQGASGPIDWDANRHVKNKLARYRVENGEYVDIQVFDCIASTACELVP